MGKNENVVRLHNEDIAMLAWLNREVQDVIKNGDKVEPKYKNFEDFYNNNKTVGDVNGENKKVKLDRMHIESLLEGLENRKGIAEKYVKQGFAEEWLIKIIELIGIYEDVLVNKVEEGIGKEELDFQEKVNREEFDLYRKYYFGDEYRLARRRVEDRDRRGKWLF